MCVRLEMVLEDRRKSFQVHIQYNSVLMLLDCNFPMQMEQQGLNHVQMNVNAMQNLVCQNGIVINLGNLAYLALEVSKYTQYGLSRFQAGVQNLLKNLHTQRKLLNSENWFNG